MFINGLLIALHLFSLRIIHGHVLGEISDQGHYAIKDFTKATINGAITHALCVDQVMWCL